ncbi:hypothetical protein GGR56DRAFT_680146 [Xylariaceae sp. FL0804]|nr:hypothetical protein GGR56DRAFT_680146 [Xylariaceae sp. FL0804]
MGMKHGSFPVDMGLGILATAKAFPGGSRPPPKVVLAVASLLVLSYIWAFQLLGAEFGYGFLEASRWQPKDTQHRDDSSAGGGLRIVVFGGGDVATPDALQRQHSNEVASWTEVLCKELECEQHISQVPVTDGPGGALLSSSLYQAALNRIASSAADRSSSSSAADSGTAAAALDWSWAADHYPVPARDDLTAQIAAFLAGPAPATPPRETLWVFSFGYWDVWHLAALPRRLATEVVDAAVAHLFSQIEFLYEEAQVRGSVAFSDLYLDQSPSNHHHQQQQQQQQRDDVDESVPDNNNDNNNNGTAAAAGGGIPAPAPARARASFRVLVPRLFDVSLAPGFAASRGHPSPPPPPHASADQLRSAAFLTRYWDAAVADTAAVWLASPDPEAWPVDDDSLSIDVVRAVIGDKHSSSSSPSPPMSYSQRQKQKKEKEKQKQKGRARRDMVEQEQEQEQEQGQEQGQGEERNQGEEAEVQKAEEEKEHRRPPPAREAVSYDLARYVREAMADAQLRAQGAADLTGLGARGDGFADAATPCVASVPLRPNNSERAAAAAVAGKTPVVAGEEEAGGGGGGGGGGREIRRDDGGDDDEHDANGGGACAEPREHLFYTGFVVGRRAVEEIGRRAAAQVREGSS